MQKEKFNRLYHFRDEFKDHWLDYFKITPEELDKVEGVMFHYSDNTVELRDKNYEVVARATTSGPIAKNRYYIVFERNVIGLQNFNKFLKSIGSKQEKLEWMEVWSDGLLKTSYHWQLDMEEEADGLVDLFYRNK